MFFLLKWKKIAFFIQKLHLINFWLILTKFQKYITFDVTLYYGYKIHRSITVLYYPTNKKNMFSFSIFNSLQITFLTTFLEERLFRHFSLYEQRTLTKKEYFLLFHTILCKSCSKSPDFFWNCKPWKSFENVNYEKM